MAAVGCLLLIVSTFGAFTFVEVAEIVTALAVLLLLKRRADGYEFHLPFGLFDRPLGQSALALACALLILGAGIRERAKRPMDDLPEETLKIPRNVMEREDDAPTLPVQPRRPRPPQ